MQGVERCVRTQTAGRVLGAKKRERYVVDSSFSQHDLSVDILGYPTALLLPLRPVLV